MSLNYELLKMCIESILVRVLLFLECVLYMLFQ